MARLVADGFTPRLAYFTCACGLVFQALSDDGQDWDETASAALLDSHVLTHPSPEPTMTAVEPDPEPQPEPTPDPLALAPDAAVADAPGQGNGRSA